MQALIGEAGRRGGRWSSRRGEGSEAGERTGGLEEAEGERERSEMAGSRVTTYALHPGQASASTPPRRGEDGADAPGLLVGGGRQPPLRPPGPRPQGRPGRGPDLHTVRGGPRPAEGGRGIRCRG